MDIDTASLKTQFRDRSAETRMIHMHHWDDVSLRWLIDEREGRPQVESVADARPSR